MTVEKINLLISLLEQNQGHLIALNHQNQDDHIVTLKQNELNRAVFAVTVQRDRFLFVHVSDDGIKGVEFDQVHPDTHAADRIINSIHQRL